MASKSPTRFHNHWGQVSDSTELPNVSGATIQDAALEAGDLCYSVADTNTYQCTVATVGTAAWALLGGTAATPLHFQFNGVIGGVTVPTDFIDGLREVGVNADVSAVILSQEIDGSAGTTKAELYKVDTAGTETQITVTDSLSLTFGGGDKARALSASFIGTNNELSSSDRLGIKFTGTQTGAEDVTITVILTGGDFTPPPGLPEDNEVTQATNKSVTGTVFEVVGTVYLPVGTILSASSHVFLGTDNVGGVAELEIRDALTSTLIDTITATGLLQDTQPTGDIGIPSETWYNLRLRATVGGITATVLGLKFVYSAGNGTRIRQGMDAQVVGSTFTNVGAVYLPAGTLQAPARIFMGATTVGPDGAEVELRRETGATLIATWTVTGTVAEATLGAAVTIPAADWYNIRLRGNGGGVTARLQGVDWTVLT